MKRRMDISLLPQWLLEAAMFVVYAVPPFSSSLTDLVSSEAIPRSF